MNEAQFRKASHALGLRYKTDEAYRNRYVVYEPDLEWEDLILRGQAQRRQSAICDGIVYFVVGDGERIVRSMLPCKPKPTKYDQYCKADVTESFSEWLLDSKAPYIVTRAGSPSYRMLRRAGYPDMVRGEWSATKKEAKASYKLALQRQRELTTKQERA